MNLSDKIEKDIITHLSAGKKPCKLTVAALAAHYKVSTTPVRIVIDRLLESGVLQKLPNGRLQSTLDENQSVVDFQGRLDDKDPYELILRDIVNKSLSKDEEFIREEGTAEKFALSRSAVREILLRISGEGMLQHIPRRGWRVRSFSQEDLDSYLQVREVMELRALELAWGKLLDIDLQEMYDGNKPAESEGDTATIDNRLHAYIVEKADNYYITDFFSRHEPFFRILFEWEGEDRLAAEETVIQHRAILGALLNRDKAAAVDSLKEHINYHHPVLKDIKKRISK